MDKKDCTLCGQTTTSSISLDRGVPTSYCRCPNCGDYRIEASARDISEYRDQAYLISGYIRELNDLGLEPEILTCDSYKAILSSSRIPRTMSDRLDKVLLYLYRKTKFLYEEIELNSSQYAIAYARSEEEFNNFFDVLIDINLIRPPHALGIGPCFSLSLDGFQRAEQINKEIIDSKQCFVAMWYEDSMFSIYDN